MWQVVLQNYKQSVLKAQKKKKVTVEETTSDKSRDLKKTKGSPSDSQQISRQKPYKPEESGGQYSTSLKKRTFNTEFHIQPN